MTQHTPTIRPARREDLPALAELFAACFPASVAHVAGRLDASLALQDLFALVLDTEPQALLVAEADGRLAGYVLAPSRTPRLRWVAFWRGHLLRAAWRWLTGRYGLRWRALCLSLRDKLAFLRGARLAQPSEARILSLAVHPDFRGQGLGRRLLEAGLQYLHTRAVPLVRLEVRPDNLPARRLYEQAGFQNVATYADAQGPWLVMTKSLSTSPAASAPPRPRWRRWVVLAAVLTALGWGLFLFLLNRPLYLANLRLRWQMPFIETPARGSRVLIVAPHPDDETLACGGLLQAAREAGAEVYVALMTNGDASEYAVLFSEKAVRRTPQQYLDLGQARYRETLSALGILGVPPAHLFSLGYPNAGLDALWLPEHWLSAAPLTSPYTRVARNPYPTSLSPGAPYCGQQVLADLHTLLDRVRPTLILSPGPFDTHPDHWATYNFVKLACEQRRLDGRPTPSLLCYLVHRRDWPAPLGYHPDELLKPPVGLAALPRLHWYALPLTEEQTRRKAQALREYRSQWPNWNRVLLALVRHNELAAEVNAPSPTDAEVIVADPIGDQPAGRQRPGGDVAWLVLRPGQASVQLSLTTAGRVDPRLNYCVVGHSVLPGTPSPWSLQVRHGQGRLTWIEQGQLRSQPVTPLIQEQALTVSLPDRLATDHLLLVEAFTMTNGRYLDHSITQAVLLRNRSQSRGSTTLTQTP